MDDLIMRLVVMSKNDSLDVGDAWNGLAEAAEALDEALEVIRRVDQMATIPAAEYVPALADIFTLTGAFLAKHVKDEQ